MSAILAAHHLVTMTKAGINSFAAEYFFKTLCQCRVFLPSFRIMWNNPLMNIIWATDVAFGSEHVLSTLVANGVKPGGRLNNDAVAVSAALAEALYK